MHKLILIGLILLGVTYGLTAQTKPYTDEGIVIGLSLGAANTSHWKDQVRRFQDLAEKHHVTFIIKNADYNEELQNNQVKELIENGVNVIIMVPMDGHASAKAVEYAAGHNVPVISHDRLIKSPQLAAYVSVDFYEIGRLQAQGILKYVSQGRFALLGGCPTDTSSERFRKGQMEVLQSLIDKGDIRIVADEWVNGWNPDNAVRIMENILAATNNGIDAIVSSNDGTALGALATLKKHGLAGKIPLSGQDATAEGCNSIARGELTMTVLKDVRLMPGLTFALALRLARGEALDDLERRTLTSLTLDESLEGDIPCLFLKSVGVDRDNLYSAIVKSGYQSYDDVYRDIPEKDRPPRP